MKEKETAYNNLHFKLKKFIRRYYFNKAFAHSLLLLGILVFIFLILFFVEFFFYLQPNTKTWAVGSIFLFFFIGFLYLVFYPLGQSLHWFRQMTLEEAAKIVGYHFKDIEDKILNTIQLGAKVNQKQNELLLASIHQKAIEINPLNFFQAIDFSKTKHWLKMACIPLGIVLFFVSFSRDFRQSADRLYHFQQEYKEPSPFDFFWINTQNFGYKSEPIKILMQTVGQATPEKVEILINGFDYKMKKIGQDTFECTVKNPLDDIEFRFKAGDFFSKKYTIPVLKHPRIISCEMTLVYPPYTKIQPKKTRQIGFLEVPEGTIAKWQIKTENVHQTSVAYQNQLKYLDVSRQPAFQLDLTQDYNVCFKAVDSKKIRFDSIEYKIKCIQDKAPEIELKTTPDEEEKDFMHSAGIIKDDYGLGKLFLVVESKEKSQKIEIQKVGKGKIQTFAHSFRISDLAPPGESFSFFYRIYDNNAILGAQFTDSKINQIKRLSKKEMEKKIALQKEEIQNSFGQSDKKLDDLNSKLSEMKIDVLQKEMDWETKNKLQNILKEHQESLQKLEKIGKELNKKNQREKDLLDLDEDLKQRQEELNKESKSLMDEEIKKLLEEIEKLMDKNQWESLPEKLNQLSKSNQEVKNQLERLKELFKELELEKLSRQTAKKLELLAKKQLALAKQKSDSVTQKEIQKAFEKIKNDLDQIDQQNKGLQSPKKLNNGKDKQKQIDSTLKKINENIKNQQIKNTQKNQQSAGEQMEKLGQDLNEMMMEANQKQYQEDYNHLRMILENLLQLSFDQEELLLQYQSSRSYQKSLTRKQKSIQQDFVLVKDSLQALSTRVPEINKIVKKKIGIIEEAIEDVKIKMKSKEWPYVPVKQQTVMKEMNELANLMQDILGKMQEQMKALSKAKSQGKPSMACKKPGQGKKPKQGEGAEISKMQQSLKKQLIKLHQNLQTGQKPGAKDFAEAAQIQGEIREKLAKFRKEMNQKGEISLGNQIKQTEKLMDDIEKNLFNKQLNQNMINRIKKIETRLLSHQNAEQKQQESQKRQGKEGPQIIPNTPKELEAFLKQTQNSKEQLKQIAPHWNQYYKNKAENYLRSIQ